MKKGISKTIDLFFYKNEYRVLEIAGVLSGLLIIGIANKLFFETSIYYFLFVVGLVVAFLGFGIEHLIKSDKRKTIEREFSYFLADLGRDYKNTRNLGVSLTNISESNFYGSINRDIRKLANKVSWGESFEDALQSMNYNINSSIIKHCLSLLKVLKETSVTYDHILINLSKDATIFKSEKTTEKYFNNLFLLSIVFYFVFLLMLLYIDFIMGKQFLWIIIPDTITRLFLNNFLLYIGLLLSFFTSFVMCVIKQRKPLYFFKYVFIFFIVTVMLFQIFTPKPDAEEIVIEAIDYLSITDQQQILVEKTIGVKSISSKSIVDNSDAEKVHFIEKKDKDCGVDCAKYTIVLDSVVFLNFEIVRKDKEFFVYYDIQG